LPRGRTLRISFALGSNSLLSDSISLSFEARAQLLLVVYSLIDVLLSIRLEGLAVAMVHVARPIDYSTRLANAGKESHPRPMFLSSTQEEPNQYSSLGLPNLTSEHCSTIRACNAIYTKRALIA